MIIFKVNIEVFVGVCARFSFTGHAGVRGSEIADKLSRDGSVQWFVGPDPFLWVSRQNTRRKIQS